MKNTSIFFYLMIKKYPFNFFINQTNQSECIQPQQSKFKHNRKQCYILSYFLKNYNCQFKNMKSKVPLTQNNSIKPQKVKEVSLKNPAKQLEKPKQVAKNVDKPKENIKINNNIPRKEIKKPTEVIKQNILQQNPKQQEALLPCKTCERTFNEQALKKHEKVCKKVFVNKRKQFNSAKQRIVSNEQQKVLQKKKVSPPTKKKTQKLNILPLWKQQSLALRVAMKQVKGKPKTEDQIMFSQKAKEIQKSNLVKCKFCGRSFNQTAATKHVPFCQKKSKQQAMKKLKK